MYNRTFSHRHVKRSKADLTALTRPTMLPRKPFFPNPLPDADNATLPSSQAQRFPLVHVAFAAMHESPHALPPLHTLQQPLLERMPGSLPEAGDDAETDSEEEAFAAL